VDAPGARNAWRAFAWPRVLRDTSRRAYFIDQTDRICESANPLGYAGTSRMPLPDALPDGPSCGPDRDGSGWHAWRNKKPRGPR